MPVIYFHILFFLLFRLSLTDDDFLLVRKISTGYVRGRPVPIEPNGTIVAPNGQRAFMFLGIPYAKRPIGKLRFRPATEPTQWNGVRDASQYGPSCIYNTSFVSDYDTTPIPMSEDCLLVNIFASEKCLLKGGCPVFQYIYGGQFMFGTARKLDPQIIAENFCSMGRDLVVVTFGYRMNVFGLLNLNYRFFDVNPPNTAIHDILASLHWTRREIVQFGGDPARITLGGESSGSVAAQILSVCPRANFLFHQVISMSGPGTIEMLPKNRNQRSSRRLAFALDCVNEANWKSEHFWSGRANVSAVMDCLEKLSAERIASALPGLEAEGLYFHGLATEIGPKGIIRDTFQNLVAQNAPKHALLTGTVSKEFKDAWMAVVDAKTGRIDGRRLWLYCRRLVRQLNYENGAAALSACSREYNDVGRVQFLFEDVNYFVPHYNFAAATSRQGVPTFLYQFEYAGIGTAYAHPPNRFGTEPEWTPKHVQDLVYLLGQNKGIFTAKDRRLQRLHSALFANFIANGTPNGGEIGNARQFRPEHFNYYRIDFEDQQNWTELAGDTRGYHKRAIQFWDWEMAKVAGKAHWLSDEALIDDQMMSEYIAEDMAKMEQQLAEWNGAKASLWPSLLLVLSTFLCLVAFTLLALIFWAWIGARRRGGRRRKAEYIKINGN